MILATKVNHLGIAVGNIGNNFKLGECSVTDNHIVLNDGRVGIMVIQDDTNIVKDNQIDGLAYWGLVVEGGSSGATYNILRDNNMKNLWIKVPNPNDNAPVTANAWLQTNTEYNVVKLDDDETVIDDGTNNQIIYNNQ